jgi:serine/threonine protein kinase
MMIDIQSNILISPSGTPLITGFGFWMYHVGPEVLDGPQTFAGSERYLAVELSLPSLVLENSSDDTAKLLERHKFHTTQSDVWAFAMVLYVRKFCIK